jgi:preprotein translocase subunit YajC
MLLTIIPPSWVAGFVSLLAQTEGGAPAERFKGNAAEEFLFGGKSDGVADAADAAGGGSDMTQFFLMIGMLIAVFYFLMIRPERKRMKTREAMLGKLQKGNTVVTNGGLVGKIFRVEEKEVIIVVDKDSNVKMRFLRSAVNEVIPETKTVEKQT